MTQHAILPSRNEDYGFFRTLTVCPERDRRSAEVWTLASRLIAEGRCCRTLTVEDSHRESMRLDGLHEQANTRPLSHDELVQLHGFSAQARIAAYLAGQRDDLARAA